MDSVKRFGFTPKKTLLCLAVAGLIGCGGKTAQDHLNSAEQYYQDSNTQAAVIELKNSLKQEQELAQARALLGKIYAETGRPADAEKELKRAIEYGIAFEDVALTLADTLLIQGKAKQAIEDFAISPEDSADLIALKSAVLGESHMQTRDYTTAKQFFESAAENQSVRQRALTGKALIALINKDNEGAKQIIEQAIAIDPQDAKTWMTKADILMASQESEAAEDALHRVVKLATNKSSNYYQAGMRHLIRMQLGRNDLDNAQSTLETLKQVSGGYSSDPFLTYLRSILAYKTQDFESASELANQVLTANNNHLGAKLIIGLSDAQLGKFVQAETHLQNFVAQVPTNDQARKTLALVQTQTKNPERALETLAPFGEKIEELDRGTLALLAQTSYLAGKSDQSTHYLQEALKKAPDDPRLNFALAQTLTAQNDYDQALSILSTLEGTTQQKQQALFTQAQIHIRSQKYDEALAILEKLTGDLPDKPAPVVLTGSVYFAQGQLEAAREHFQKAINLNPVYIPAIRSLALLEIRAENFQGAESAYETALKSDQINDNIKAQLLIDSSQLLVRQQKLVEAEEKLLLAKSIPQAEIQSSVLLARLYLGQGKPQLAKDQLLEHQDNNNAALLTVLGNAQMMSGEFNSALGSYRRLSLLQPGSPAPNHQIATAQMRIGDTEGAKKSLQQSLAINPGYLPALQANVNLAIQQLEFADAHEALAQLKAAAPEHPSASYLEAELAMAENEPAKASPLYLSLYQKAPNNTLRQKLVNAWAKSNQSLQAMAFLKEDIAKNPKSSHAHLLLANLHMSQQDNNSAIDSYRKVLALNTKQVVALNNLAWLLKDSNAQEALAYAEQAHELVPDNPDIKDTLDQVKAILAKR